MKAIKKNSKLNVKLLRRIQKHILEEPRRFFMAGVVITGDPGKAFPDHWAYVDLPGTVPPCGTAACVHGWTALLSGKTIAQTKQLNFAWSRRALGLPVMKDESNDPLFYADNWPEPFRGSYRVCKEPAGRAEIASKRIDHLIKTGE